MPRPRLNRTTLIGGIAAAAVVASGATALALTESASTAATPLAGTSAASAPRPTTPPAATSTRDGKRAHRLMRHLVHGEIVVRHHGGFVTRDFVKGTVTSVSASSITVLAADRTSETFVVAGTTKVTSRVDHQRSDSSIGAVHRGDRVRVVGTGTTTKTAKRVVDRGAK